MAVFKLRDVDRRIMERRGKDQLRFDAPEDAETYASENFTTDEVLIV